MLSLNVRNTDQISSFDQVWDGRMSKYGGIPEIPVVI